MTSHDEVQDLRRQLVEKVKRINSLEDNEAMLREQVRTFREDFESERRDREQAQSRIASLESELATIKQQQQQRNIQTMQDLYERRQAKLEYYRQQYEQQPHQNVFTSTGSDEGEDEIDATPWNRR